MISDRYLCTPNRVALRMHSASPHVGSPPLDVSIPTPIIAATATANVQCGMWRWMRVWQSRRHGRMGRCDRTGLAMHDESRCFALLPAWLSKCGQELMANDRHHEDAGTQVQQHDGDGARLRRPR